MKTSFRKKNKILKKPLLNSPINKRHPQVIRTWIQFGVLHSFFFFFFWSTSFLLVITGICFSSRAMQEVSVFLKLLGNLFSLCSHLSVEAVTQIKAVEPIGSREF